MSNKSTQENILPAIRESQDAVAAGKEATFVTPSSVLGLIFAAAIATRKGTEALFTLVPHKFIAVAMNSRNGGKEAAPAVVIGTSVDGTPSLPVQVAGYSGGIQLDMVQANGTMAPLARWGYNPAIKKYDAPEYSNNCTMEFADLCFEVASIALDSQEGVAFLASLKDAATIDAAASNRSERRGFKRILAVNSNHHATARRSDSAESYLAVAAQRAVERTTKSATRNVTVGLPF